MEKSKELETAISAAKEAGKILLERMGSYQVVSFKDRQDICTTADLDSEKMIIKVIEKAFPSHNIISEEAGENKKGSEFSWYADPLDGTKNFVRNIPIFSVSVSLADERGLIAGAVFDPLTKRLYFAERGKGAFFNNKKIGVSNIAEPEDAFVYVDSQQMKFNRKLGRVYRTRDFGVGSLALCYLAQGGFDVYIQDKFILQDHSAGVLISKEAGAIITELNGEEFSLKSKNVLVANPLLHKKILPLVKID